METGKKFLEEDKPKEGKKGKDRMNERQYWKKQ